METLEDLLAEDGFKRLRSKRRPGRIGGTASAATASRDSSLTDPHIGSYGSGLQPERTRSDVATRRSTSIMSEKGGFTEPRPTNFSGRKLGSVDLYEEHSPNVQDRKGRHSNLLEETMEFGGRSGKYHWYVNNVEELDRSHSSRSSSCSKDGHSENVHERLGHYRGYNNTLFEVDEKTSEKTITFPVKSDLKKIGDGCPVPSLDDASLKAIASILNSFVNQLIENGKSRSFLSQNCASSLKSGVLKERIKLKDGVISTLNEAIGAVEQIITDGFNQLEIKKTSLKLSVISGLTSMKSDDGCTSGIANSHLAACAHLYLSILYKIQKKDKVSAKHLLQVFCDSPHNARTKLLPELWDRIFLPQFSLLNAWYDEKVQSVQGTSGMRMKLEHLEKVHNEVLDTGTCQFAAYYMDWLMGDNMSPSLPSIAIPFVSFPEIYSDSNTSVAVESVSSRNSVPSHTMISRSLYESILSPSKKIGTTYEMESEEEEDAKYKEVETDYSHSNDWRIRFDGFDQENEETSQSPNSGPYSVEGLQENHMAGSRDSDAYSEENEACSVYWMDETDSKNRLSYSRSIKESSRIPLDFLCPLTGQLLKDPVTLVSGFTFERVAIKEWFDQGNKTCPVTGQTLNCSSIPETNVVLKQMINEWIAKCFRDLSSSSEGSFSRQKGHCNSNFSRALLLIEQVLVGFGVVDEKKNIQLLMSLGGMLFLTEVIGLGSLDEQSHATELLLRCIKADGCYRNYIAMNIGIPFLLELVNCKEFGLRNNAVLLLIELFWLKRMEIMSFLSGLKEDAICETMHELLACLQCSVPEERVLIAVLLLQFAQMVETQKVSGYKKEAIDCIIVALDCCLSNGKIIANCRRALLTLGGHFSSSGEILTETWLLKQAGYDDFSSYTKEEDLILSKEESNERETWLKEMALSLLGYGKKLFVETLSKCLDSRSPDLVRVCLATTAWLSRALSSLSPAAFPASSFFVILPGLKESLMNDLDTKNRVLASLCLLNFSRIPEFRIPIITFADEIHDPLNSLAKVTWTAKMLYQDIFAETL